MLIASGHVALLLAGCAAISACGGLKMRTLDPRNPTSYIFSYPATDVRLAMERAFRGMGYRNLSFATATDNDPFVDSVFSIPQNVLDGYLYLTSGSLGFSSVYFLDGDPTSYHANVHLHFETVGEGKTKIDVRTITPRVVVGTDPSSHGGSAQYQLVEPTTIEEYELLRRIGEELGERAMPPVLRP